MKKIIWIMAFTLCVLLAGCQADTNNSGSSPESNPESKPVTVTENGDLADWNGFDFGPNLQYAEEYELQGDPGEYMSAFEAAKFTFDTARENGNIPAYSNDTEYTMTLVALESIEGEECYVYRLDVGEPTGTIGAAYAYAYQSGNIYMQGYGGQYVLVNSSN